MKAKLRSAIERVFKRLPVSRFAYIQRDALQARLDAIEARDRPLPDLPGPVHDPRQLETLTPVMRTPEERTSIAARCRDADVMPKAANAGAVLRQDDGTLVQVMHNGLKVLAGGYYGEWMQDLITRCNGHHEPQEELLFAEVLRHLPPTATMIELGGFWCYYSIWFLTQDRRRRAIAVEPDPRHLEIGRANARLNDCAPIFVHAFAGPEPAPPAPFRTEASGVVELACVSVASLLDAHGIGRLDLLHCDAQGIELAVLESGLALFAANRIDWLIVSTHAHQISGDPLTHQRCLAVLRQAGATILAEHDVHESFSGDGLIVARFGPAPDGWSRPRLSYNRYSTSLFRNPLYDLAEQHRAAKPAPALATPATAIEQSASFALAGTLLAIKADCALGDAGDRLLMPIDKVMFPEVLAQSGWALETLTFLDQQVDPAKSYLLLDIGANIGLFSRQVARRFVGVSRILCVEAEPANFNALQYNLSGLENGRSKLWNLALSDSNGEMRFFRDRDNFGNYSLNYDAMRDRPYDTTVVQAVDTSDWMRKHVPHSGQRIIWKSDTQGVDELVISRTPIDVWDRVDAAIIELWRIKKLPYDRDAFVARIDRFPNKSIGPSTRSTTSDILAYLDGDDWQHADLYLWR